MDKYTIRKEIYTKDGSKWTQGYIDTDITSVYKSLASDMVHKKLHKCTYIRSIKDTPLYYNDMRRITVYFDNAVKAVYYVVM